MQHVKLSLLTHKFIWAGVFSSALFLIPLLSFSLLPPIKDSNAAETQINANVSYGIYSVTIEASPTVAIDIASDPVGTMSVVSSSVKTTTTAPNGYKLYLSMTGNTNDLINTTNNNLRIPSTKGTLTSPTALSAEGTWGYALSSNATKVITPNGFDATYTTGDSFTPNNNKFASVPAHTPQLIAESTTPSAAAGDTLNIYYGVSVNYNVPNGTYSNTVAYTAIADSGAGHNLYLSPTSTTNVDGGEPLTVATTLYATTSDPNNPTTSNIDANVYLLTASELANVHNNTPVSLYNSKKLTCSRITSAPTLSFDCTTIAAAKGSYYIYVEVPTYSTSYEAPFLVTDPSGFFTLTTMQQMATYPEYCTAATTPSTTAQYEDTDGTHVGDPNYVPTLTLTDTRDGERYKIRKLADGNCWMTENLRLELTQGDILTPDDTDVAVNTTVGATTQPYDQPAGDNRYDWGVADATSTNYNKTTVDRWLSRSTKVNGAWATETNPSNSDTNKINRTGEDQKLGVYYNWYTATASTGTYDMSTVGIEAQSSVCPAGWELPRYSNVAGTSTLAPSASWMGLIRDTYHVIVNQGDQTTVPDGNINAGTQLSGFPFSLPYSGVVSWTYGYTAGQGAGERIWSNGTNSQVGAQQLYFNNTNAAPENGYYRLAGFTVRCVAKTFWSISEMQQMNPQIAASAATPANDASTLDTNGSHYGEASYIPQNTLTDARDGETYRVRKLADGNIWMTENLRLGSAAATMTLTSSDSDVASDFVLPTAQTSGTDAWSDATNSTDSKHVYITDNTDYGNYYNWYTATAGTGVGTMVSTSTTDLDNASASICAKGWRLPDGGESTNRSFYQLDKAYGGNGSVRTDTAQISKFAASPLSFSYSGYYHYSNGTGINRQGTAGFWWSRSAYTTAGKAYYLGLRNYNGEFRPQHVDHVSYGVAVRCLAK